MPARIRKTLVAVLTLVLGSSIPLWAQESSPQPTFRTIMDEQTARTFDTVKSYIETNPKADDAEQAYEWLFKTATEQGWESKTVPIATKYLERTGGTRPWKDLAARVRSVGWARSGQWEDALLEFERQLQNVRLRAPVEIVDLAKTLATEAQIAGRPETAQEIFQNLSRTLFLNPDVKQLAETKLAKLELVGKPAPALTIKTLEGQALDLADYKGQWLLVDFWATNCPPCLEEMPRLKQLYEAQHARGFEIVGISLDEDAQTVQSFQKQHKLPWPLALSDTDEGKTRENYHVPTIPALYLIDPEGKIDLIDPRLSDLERLLPDRLKSRKAQKP